MRERAKITTKTSESEKENLPSYRQADFSQKTDSPHDHIPFLQRTIGNQAVHRMYKSGVFQAKLRTGQSGDIYEQEADKAAEHISQNRGIEGTHLTPVEPSIQRFPAADTTSTPSPPTEVPATPVPPTEETPTEKAAPTLGLIVEDSVTELAPGQMRKSEFLSQLRASVCSTAEDALSGTIWSVMGCPWIDRWIGYYSGRNSQQIEQAIRRYAPEAAGAAKARDYIPLISARVRRAIDAWATTGEVAGVPEGVPGSTKGSPLESGGILLKRREGSTEQSGNPQEIQGQLGSGRPLDSGMRSRMEPVFGQSFSGVRIHTDAKGAQLSNDLNARAFTIGSDIAFGQGEYKPGTLIGDALIAHELAHTVQQGGRGSSSEIMPKNEVKADNLENEADTSAIGAVAALWGGIRGGLTNMRKNAFPMLRTGLRLQRCGKKDETKSTETKTKEKPKDVPAPKGDTKKEPEPKEKEKKATIPEPPKDKDLTPIGKYCSLYKVKKGDTYSELIKKFSKYTDKAHFDKANRFKAKDYVKEGFFLVVPHWSKWKEPEKKEMKKQLEALVAEVAKKHDIPVHILKGLVDKESGWERKSSDELANWWDPCVRSPTGPVGIVQMTKKTAKEQGLSRNLLYKTKLKDAIDERLDPKIAVEKGAIYLKRQFGFFTGAVNTTEQWRCALGAYNQGFGAVKKGRTEFKKKNPGKKYTWLDIAKYMDKGPRGKAKNYVKHIAGKSGEVSGYAAEFEKMEKGEKK